jgi:hypothetical protein
MICDIKQPTLIELVDFVNNNSIYFEQKEIDTINKFKKQSTESWAKNSFYLYGQLLISITEPITQIRMDEAVSIHNNKIKTYGLDDPRDIASANNAYYEFNILKNILQKYNEKIVHEMYRPPDVNDINDRGGSIYQFISNTTMVGKS